MSEVARFFAEVHENIDGLREDAAVRQATLDWINAIAPHNYTYNFTWLGRPVIQFPQDLAALQEIIWDTRPNLIVETGIAHGGSLIFHASMLQLLGTGGRVIVEGPGVISWEGVALVFEVHHAAGAPAQVERVGAVRFDAPHGLLFGGAL